MKQKNPQITATMSVNRTYVGYCHSPSHKGYMVLGAVCNHQCLEKECPRFEKLEHPIWTDKSYTTQQISYKKLQRIKQNYADYSLAEEGELEDMAYQLSITTYVDNRTGVSTAKLHFGHGNGFYLAIDSHLIIDVDVQNKLIYFELDPKKKAGFVVDRFNTVTLVGKKAGFLSNFKGCYEIHEIAPNKYEANLMLPKQKESLIQEEKESVPAEPIVTEKITVKPERYEQCIVIKKTSKPCEISFRAGIAEKITSEKSNKIAFSLPAKDNRIYVRNVPSNSTVTNAFTYIASRKSIAIASPVNAKPVIKYEGVYDLCMDENGKYYIDVTSRTDYVPLSNGGKAAEKHRESIAKDLVKCSSPKPLDLEEELSVQSNNIFETEEILPIKSDLVEFDTKNKPIELSEKAIKELAVKYVRSGDSDTARNIAAAYKVVKDRHGSVTEDTINDTIFELLIEDDVITSEQIGNALNILLGEIK